MHDGRVQSFDNQLNAGTGTLRVRAIFENKDGALVPGLFARVMLGSAANATVTLVTDKAIGTDQNKKFVMVVGEDNKAVYREVKLGGLVDNLRVITDGLKVGEKIVVDGLQRVQPGAPVTPEVVPMEGKPVQEEAQETEQESKPERPEGKAEEQNTEDAKSKEATVEPAAPQKE